MQKIGGVVASERGHFGGRKSDERSRVAAEHLTGVRDERERVEIEGFAFGRNERGETEPAFVDLVRFDGDERAIDELAGSTCARDELAIAVGLALHLVADAVACGLHFSVETACFLGPPTFANESTEADGRHCRDDTERDDELRSELHACFRARDAVPQSTPKYFVGSERSATRPP